VVHANGRRRRCTVGGQQGKHAGENDAVRPGKTCECDVIPVAASILSGCSNLVVDSSPRARPLDLSITVRSRARISSNFSPRETTAFTCHPHSPPHHTPKTSLPHNTMAKGARASSKKANRTKLRARVFGPADKARAERIHAKLLETISQPKPDKTDMDTAEDCEPMCPPSQHTPADNSTATTDAAKEDDKGSSFLTASIPRSLSAPSSTRLDPAQENCELRNLCFYLGLCSDVVGFTEHGDLQFAFDPLAPHWLSENQGLTVT
jgi:hypothetical protein